MVCLSWELLVVISRGVEVLYSSWHFGTANLIFLINYLLVRLCLAPFLDLYISIFVNFGFMHGNGVLDKGTLGDLTF